jgi:hypothetical protein
VKIALITTTIYVPRVLELYRAIGPDVRIIVTGDRKTPHAETRAFVTRLGNAQYYSDTDQEKLGYRSSELIGWNKIMRRNIALLEAIREGAEIIVSIDDDNTPLDERYFADFERTLTTPYHGVAASAGSGWFNIGEFFQPPFYHRGFPYERRGTDLGLRMDPLVGGTIGVAAGLWLGDPDIDAMERITNRPRALNTSDVVRAGIAVASGCWTPFNTQNTAFVRELAPLIMVLVGVGRYDDIWASYILQRIAMEAGKLVHFGRPLVWQDRNVHNLWTNLKDEIYGMEHTPRFCADLRAARLGSGAPLEKLARLYEHLSGLDYLPPIVCELGRAWCRDVEKVL